LFNRSAGFVLSLSLSLSLVSLVVPSAMAQKAPRTGWRGATRRPDGAHRPRRQPRATLEPGRCVARDNRMAAEYPSEAARRGHRPAALRMARKFGRGGGLPQSYANAAACQSASSSRSVSSARCVSSEALSLGALTAPVSRGRRPELGCSSFTTVHAAPRLRRAGCRAGC
jgi:hypothetical protein